MSDQPDELKPFDNKPGDEQVLCQPEDMAHMRAVDSKCLKGAYIFILGECVSHKL